MNRDQGAYNLSNSYRPLFTTSNQSSDKQSKSRDEVKVSLMTVLDENWNSHSK